MRGHVSVKRREHPEQPAECRSAVVAALASVRAEGLEPSATDLDLFASVAQGELTTEELRHIVVQRYFR